MSNNRNHLLKSISKSQLFIAVSLAFAANASQALTALQEIHIITGDTTYTTGIQAGSSNPTGLEGSTGAEVLTFAYQDTDKKGIIQTEQNKGILYISKFSKVHFDNQSTSDTVTGVTNWWGSNSIKFKDIGTLSFGTKDSPFRGDAIQANGGPIQIDVDNLYINSTQNGLYLQQNDHNTNATNGNLIVKATNSIDVNGSWCAVYLASDKITEGSTLNPRIELQAKTINLSSDDGHGVAIQDTTDNSALISINADEDIFISGVKKYNAINILSLALEGNTSANPATGSKTINIKSLNGSVTLKGGDCGITRSNSRRSNSSRHQQSCPYFRKNRLGHWQCAVNQCEFRCRTVVRSRKG